MYPSYAITRLFFEASSVPFCGMICLYLFLLYRETTPTVKMFRKFSVTIFAENVIDVICGYLNGMVTYEHVLVAPAFSILIVNLIDVVGGAMCSYYFLQYAAIHAGHRLDDKVRNHLSRLVVFADGLLMTINLFNGCVMSISEDEITLHHGSLYQVGIYLPSMILLFWGILIILRHFQKYSVTQRILLLATAFLVAGLIWLQAAITDVYLVLFAVSVGELGLLFTLETPDYMALKKALARLQKTQETLRVARQRAEDASIAKSEFIISTADQFRNPISAILGFSRLIASGTTEAKIRDYAEKVQEAGQRLRKVFDSIVYYTASDYHEDEAYERPKVASIEDKELFTDYMEEWNTWEHAQNEVGADGKKDAKAAREQDVLAFAQANAPVEEGKSLFSRPVSVLAIDDNNMNLFLISNRLRRFGAQADIANSAESALSMASEKSYDLILMDRYLPSMNGPELVRAMREQKLCEGTPIVLMSAGSEDTKEELRREGFAGSLPKPFTLHQLRDLLIQVLPESVDKTLPEVQEVLSGKEDAPVEEDTKEEAPEEEDAPEEKETTIPVSLRPAFYLFGLVLVLVYILMVLLLAKGSVRVVLMTVGCAVYLLLDLFYCRLTGSSAKTIRILPLPLILLCILAGTLGASESEAFLFFPVLLITPLLLQRASPAWNRLVLVLSSALFLLLDFSEKTRDIFQKDLIHTVSALILAVVFSLVLQRQRAQEEDLLSRYRELSEYDRMTHTKNYDRMREDLKPLFGQKVTFLYTSIDRFRLICDTCGTQEANDLLSFFAATLQKIFGEEHCYRYYGAVFLVISTDLSLEELRKKCSEFGRAVSRYEIAHRRLHPTCSGSYDRILLTGEEDLQSLNHRLGMKLYEIQTLGNKRFEQAERSPFSEGD